MHLLSELILPIWLIFWVYWVVSATTSKKNVYSKLRNKFVGLRLVLFVFVLLFLSDSLRLRYTASASFASQLGSSWVGIGFIVFIAGLALAIWARIFLGKNWGMPMTLKQDPELVTSGPYRLIRHPIYSGILIGLLGTALAINLYWLIALAAEGAYFIYSATIEEKNMIRLFPKTYPAYKQKTKMLIPYVY